MSENGQNIVKIDHRYLHMQMILQCLRNQPEVSKHRLTHYIFFFHQWKFKVFLDKTMIVVIKNCKKYKNLATHYYGNQSATVVEQIKYLGL